MSELDKAMGCRGSSVLYLYEFGLFLCFIGVIMVMRGQCSLKDLIDICLFVAQIVMESTKYWLLFMNFCLFCPLF